MDLTRHVQKAFHVWGVPVLDLGPHGLGRCGGVADIAGHDCLEGLTVGPSWIGVATKGVVPCASKVTCCVGSTLAHRLEGIDGLPHCAPLQCPDLPVGRAAVPLLPGLDPLDVETPHGACFSEDAIELGERLILALDTVPQVDVLDGEPK